MFQLHFYALWFIFMLMSLFLMLNYYYLLFQFKYVFQNSRRKWLGCYLQRYMNIAKEDFGKKNT